jgi:hypothetical protein
MSSQPQRPKGPGALFLMFLAVMISGCASIPEINTSFRKIDRAWQLEYQETEDAFRHRVIDAPYRTVYAQVKKTFLDLAMPIQKADVKEGIIVVENEAPHPLTHEEWKRVVKVENPRVKALGGWMFSLRDEPKGYIVTVRAGLRAIGDKTFVLLDYKLDMPKYREMGITPSEHAPPLAVQLGAAKFWAQLKSNLEKINLPEPRKRTREELYVEWFDNQFQWSTGV